MNTSTTDCHAIASCQNFSQADLDRYIETQAQNIAPEPLDIPTDPIAARLRLNNHHRIREAIADGEMYWQCKQNFNKLKDFKDWLEVQHFTWKTACKYLKLYEVFAEFSITQIGWVDLQTLFQLCQPRYKELLQQLRSLPVWTETKIQELMQQWRDSRKKERPNKSEPRGLIGEDTSPTARLVTGWRQLPGGGRGYQLPMLHIDWLGVLIERAKKIRCCTVSQLVADMTVFFVEAGLAPGLSVAEVRLRT